MYHAPWAQPASYNFVMNPNEQLRQEFNQWAEDGRGTEMGAAPSLHHRTHDSANGDTSRRAHSRYLGCGTGWATRLLARLVGEGPEDVGQVVGLDIADEMIRQARAASREFENVMYVVVRRMKFHGRRISSTRYCRLSRSTTIRIRSHACRTVPVFSAQRTMFVLINLYKDNHYSLRWVDALKVPVQVRSEAEYVQLLKAHAFEDVQAFRIPDETPTPDEYSGQMVQGCRGICGLQAHGSVAAVDGAQAGV